jgi:hypothetical protein
MTVDATYPVNFSLSWRTLTFLCTCVVLYLFRYIYNNNNKLINIGIGINLQDWITTRIQTLFTSTRFLAATHQSASQIFSKLSSVAMVFWILFLVWSEGFSRDSSFYLSLKSHRNYFDSKSGLKMRIQRLLS